MAATLRRQLTWNRTVLYGMALPVLAATGIMGYLTSAGQYLLMMIGFSIIIFVHELGHFLVARWCSVKCETFSIGIGHRLVGWKEGRGITFGPEKETQDKNTGDDVTGETGAAGVGTLHDLPQTAVDPDKPAVARTTRAAKPADKDMGETDYRISMLPLGGYVKMLGQDDMDATKVSNDPRSFNRRPIWQRMCIVSAGVVMNIIFAFVVFAVVFQIGVDFPPAVIGDVAYGSPADRAGFQVGDQILRIGDKGPVPAGDAWEEFADVKISSALATEGEEIAYTVRRAGTPGELTLKAVPVKGKEGMLQVGLGQSPALKVAKLDDDEDGKFRKLLDRMGASFAKLQGEDKIIKVDGIAVQTYGEFYRKVQEARGKDLVLTLVSADGKNERTDTFKTELMVRLGVDLVEYPSIAGLYPRTRVVFVSDESPAMDAKLPDNCVVNRIDSTSYPTINQLVTAVRKGNEVTIATEPTDATAATAPAAIAEYKIKPKSINQQMVIGAELGYDLNNTLIAATDDANPLWKNQRLAPNASVKSVNGTPVKNWIEVYNLLNDLTRELQPGTSAQAVFEIVPPGAAGDVRTVEITLPAPLTPDQIETQTLKAATAGTQPFPHGEMYVSDLHKLQFSTRMERTLQDLMQTQRARSTGAAMVMGFDHTRRFVIQTYMTLHGLFARTISPKELHGALGMAKIGHDVQSKGLIYLVYVLAVISVNLAVANFLPLPIVDGGLFILLIVEKIRGQPLPLKVQNVIQVAGLLLLGSLFLFVTWNDLKMFEWFKN